MLPPRKPKNKSRRVREYLTPLEIEKVIKGARNVGRHGERDAAMILLTYRHGLRVCETVSLRWEQIDFETGLMQVIRRKRGLDSIHPLFGVELRVLRKLKRGYPETEYIFITERKTPLTTSTFGKIVARAGREAKLEMPIHPHMLRHSTGFKLANEGHDTRSLQQYLGHKNIYHTTRYTEIAPSRFNKFWHD